MGYEIIQDHTQLKPGDMLEYRCPKFGYVAQWRVVGIYLGGIREESLIEVSSITKIPQMGSELTKVPVHMTRGLTIIRETEDHPNDPS